METSTQHASVIPEAILHRAASEIKREGEKTVCHFNGGGSVFLSNFLGALIRPGDEMDFPLPSDSAGTGTEIYIRKPSSSVPSRDLYQAPISYVAKPKADKRERLYVRRRFAQAGWAFPPSICLAMLFAITSLSPHADGPGDAKQICTMF